VIIESEIGKRIKNYRTKKDLTLQDLADLSGFTKGYISKVEKSKKAPPVSTLGKISKVLGIPISVLLGVNDQVSDICFVKNNDRPAMAGRGTKFGYCYEALSHPFAGKHMEPFILSYPHKKADPPVWFKHEGEEMLFVLSGKMRFLHNDKEFFLEKGDCLYFDSGIPHFGEPIECEEECKCLIVMYNE